MTFKLPLFDFPFISQLFRHQAQVYCVGGTVRDAILGIPLKDIDLLVTSIPMDKLVSVLKMEGSVSQVGKSFGVIKFRPRSHPQEEIDIALPRLEKSTGSGHREFEITFDHTLPVETDLARRDFTINAIAFNVQNRQLIDPFNGQQDIIDKTLRQVFSEAFIEDPLRILRAIQFAARFNLKMDPATMECMVKHAPLVKTVSGERIILEIQKLFLAPKPSLGFDMMRQIGLLKHIFPFVEKMIGVKQPKKNNEDVYDHTMKVLDASRSATEMEQPGDMEIMFAALLHDAGKPATVGFDEEKKQVTFYGHQNVSRKIARRWLSDYKATTIGLNVDQTINLVHNHMFETKSFYTDKAIRRFVAKVGEENIYKLVDLRIADKKGGQYPEKMYGIIKLRERIRKELEKKPPFSAKDLALNGHDLIGMGFKPGPIMGQIQKFMIEKVLDDPELNTKEQLQNLVQEHFVSELKNEVNMK